MRVEWSPRALERVADIAQYIARDDPDAAVRWVIELFDEMERLADFPESGRMVPEVGVTQIREVVFGAYRAFYRTGDFVEVLTVRHGSQLVRTKDNE